MLSVARIFERTNGLELDGTRNDKKSVLSVARLAQQQRIKKREKDNSVRDKKIPFCAV